MHDDDKLMEKTYNPKKVEKKWYSFWEENSYFSPNKDENLDTFTIVMPPPNVTGKLHMGHAMDNTMQDILVRYNRLKGLRTLWVPGTDHAGIATQAKVEAQLRKEGLSKEELGREAFVERCWEWKEEYGGTITKQIRTLGASCDWQRERFTMDEGCSEAVREAFVSLYEKELIYRGEYIVNWCPNCHTTISDIEVEHKENAGKLYYLNYFLEGEETFLTIATTRPETMLGDTAVAVHPSDERYQSFIGKNVILPFLNKTIPVISDEYVDPEFGTGVVKITPAHDVNDFEMGKRHNLPLVTIMDDSGIMNENAGIYAGLDRFEARNKIIEDLIDTPNMNHIEDYANSVGHCYRCDTIIEPRVSKQWFVKMAPLAEPALKAVYDKDIAFIPERFTKIYTGWMENIRDWCISRQLWWGHRIPVWYCQECGEILCQREDPEKCSHCGSYDLVQDEDVLDTWFSSGLWPFEVLGWPEKTKDLEDFYPTSVLVTGRDIIFFWVARMIVDGYAFTDKEPFKDVLIHGLVLDEEGRKMSKSLGNGIDPLDEIDLYGADALRLTLITGVSAGKDVRYRKEKIEAARNFTNKLWNAARFVEMNTQDFDFSKQGLVFNDTADAWIVSRLHKVGKEVAAHLESYELGEAAKLIHDFIWNEFCDWYIELIKPRFYGNVSEVSRIEAQATAIYVLKTACLFLHPFMPFITEEIWQQFTKESGKALIAEQWPMNGEEFYNDNAEESMNLIMESVRALRNVKRDFNVSPGKKINIYILAKDKSSEKVFEDRKMDFVTLAKAEEISFIHAIPSNSNQCTQQIIQGNSIYIPLQGLIDTEEELGRLDKEIKRLESEIARASGKLSNERFVAKAPEDVVRSEKEKLELYREDLDVAKQQKEKLLAFNL